MAKKNVNGRKPRGAAGIATIEASDDVESSDEPLDVSPSEDQAPPAKRPRKINTTPPSSDNYTVSDIRKAASFVNSVGGLDKAMAVLQILKVAKEVQ